MMFQKGLYRYVYCRVRLHLILLDKLYWEQIQLHTVLCATYLCFISLPNIYTYSLEWDEILWRDIGDKGAVALADPRVLKNFKTLE